MKFNGFRADVEPGGLYNVNEIKILVCIILYNTDTPFTAETLSNIIRYESLANYFDIAQAIAELEEDQNIVKNDNHEYILTENGKIIASRLNSDIPFTVREKALKSANYEITLKKRLKDNSIDIILDDDGYVVKISMKEKNKEFMGISIRVKSMPEANIVKANFLEDPTGIYVMNFRKLLGLADEEENV